MGIIKKIKKVIAEEMMEDAKAPVDNDTYNYLIQAKYSGSIIVVYDGRAPELAARNLYVLLKEIGQEVIICDADKYKYGDESHLYKFAKKIIIVGHHSLAKNELKKMETTEKKLKHDIFGIKFDFRHNMCVLRASDSELKNDRKNRELFNEYYFDSMRNHTEFVKKYNLPMVVGIREHTRDTQYDLLFLDFALYGLSEFLGLDANIKNTYMMK